MPIFSQIFRITMLDQVELIAITNFGTFETEMNCFEINSFRIQMILVNLLNICEVIEN